MIFTGHGTSINEPIITYSWRSSINGELGANQTLEKWSGQVSVGVHTIYFKVQDSSGLWSEETTSQLTIIPKGTQEVKFRGIVTATVPNIPVWGYFLAVRITDVLSDPTGELYQDATVFLMSYTSVMPLEVGEAVEVFGVYEGKCDQPIPAFKVLREDSSKHYIVSIAILPIANFNAAPTQGIKPLSVQFTDSSTGDIYSWSWSFGDDGTSTEQNPLHVYNDAGIYTVSLTVGGWPGFGTNTATKNNYIIVNPLTDNIPPASVTDLIISENTTSSVTLTWTAPGNDANVGTASKYDIRYSTSNITEANWAAATQCTGEPEPQPAGSSENFPVTGLTPDTKYYFAIKTADEVPNWSGLSNVVNGTTNLAASKFLTLPFIDPIIKIQQGWIYTFDPDPYAHQGIDYVDGEIDNSSTWQSFNVVSAADGVAMQSTSETYGKFVLIRHSEKDSTGSNYFTLYAHLDGVASEIPLKDKHDTDYSTWKPVKRGEFIGKSGATGVRDEHGTPQPTWIHLHFEVNRGGYTQNRVDPYDLYNTRYSYPGGEGYTACGSNYLWTVDPPIVYNQPPTASFTYSPYERTSTWERNPAQLEEVTFNAEDSTGQIVSYTWDFGDGKSGSGRLAKHTYPLVLDEQEGRFFVSANYKVTLTVMDSHERSSSMVQIIEIVPSWRKAIHMGDVLFDPTSLGGLGHAAIYAGNGETIEALSESWEGGVRPELPGVERGSANATLSRWDRRGGAYLIEVNCSDQNRLQAVQFATEEVGAKYLLTWLHKDYTPDQQEWYCSELVWAAYKNQGIDLEYTPDDLAISPYEIFLEAESSEFSRGVSKVVSHRGGVAVDPQDIVFPAWLIPFNPLKFLALCPVDLSVMAPNGLMVDSAVNQIPGAIYVLDDINEDGSPDKMIALPIEEPGDYVASVRPDQNALPTDVYSLRLWGAGHVTVLAQDVRVDNIPAQGYAFNPIIQPQFITENATDISISSARLNGTLTSLGAATSANISFQWGLSSGNYTSETPTQTTNITDSFYFDLSNLSFDTAYFYRVKLTSDYVSYANEKSFTTDPAAILNMAVNGNGTVTPSVGSHPYAIGTTVDITATPASGWQFGSWTGSVGNPSSPSTNITMNADKTIIANFTQNPLSGGGGGGGGAPPGVTLLSDKIQSSGIFMYDVTAKSEDKKCILEITHGVRGLDRFGQALSRITMVEAKNPAAPPEGKYIIGENYDIGPNGATFEPVITLTMCYDPGSLSENVSEKELYIAYWNGSEWSAFESTVNTETKMVSAGITHFTIFAIIYKPPPPPEEPVSEPVTIEPVVISEPATFVVSELSITPSEAKPGEQITVSVVVTNTGGKEGSYTVVLTIDGVKEATKEIGLGVNETETVTFPITKDMEGSYEVGIDGKTGRFTVIVPEEPIIEEKPTITPLEEQPSMLMIRWIIGGIIGGCVIVTALLVYLFLWRKRGLRRLL